jgi:hypothetical protein
MNPGKREIDIKMLKRNTQTEGIIVLEQRKYHRMPKKMTGSPRRSEKIGSEEGPVLIIECPVNLSIKFKIACVHFLGLE